MFEDKLKNNEERNHGRKRKYKKKNLFLGILFDAVECCLYGAFVYEFSDVMGRWQHI
jgi:hypothetical protein